jgi:hypothetical protein
VPRMSRLSLAVIALLSILPPAAGAAGRAGAYSGASSASVQGAQDIDARTDKGKVTFKVKAGKVKSFQVKGQEFSCGGQTPEVPISATFKLGDDGKGKTTYKDPVLGPFTIKITVKASGKASGSVKAGGLCEGTARFSAKRS